VSASLAEDRACRSGHGNAMELGGKCGPCSCGVRREWDDWPDWSDRWSTRPANRRASSPRTKSAETCVCQTANLCASSGRMTPWVAGLPKLEGQPFEIDEARDGGLEDGVDLGPGLTIAVAGSLLKKVKSNGVGGPRWCGRAAKKSCWEHKEEKMGGGPPSRWGVQKKKLPLRRPSNSR